MKVVLINNISKVNAHARPHFLTMGYHWFLGGMGLEERGNLGNMLDTGARGFWETWSKGLFERKRQRGTLVYIVLVTGLFVLYQVTITF